MFIERNPTPPAPTFRQSSVFLTKAGLVPISYDPYRQVASCSVPHALHTHSRTVGLVSLLAAQPQLQTLLTIKNLDSAKWPIVSIVKGMNFALIDLTAAPGALAALRVGQAPEMELDPEDGWNEGVTGALYYERRGLVDDRPGEPVIHNLRARMISRGTEDAGTGSACAALGCWLALASPSPASTAAGKADAAGEEEQPARDTTEKPRAGDQSKGDDGEAMAIRTKKPEGEKGRGAEQPQQQQTAGGVVEQHIFAIEQGIEMGRKCTIAVEVDLKRNARGQRVVDSVVLSGRAYFTMQGYIFAVY